MTLIVGLKCSDGVVVGADGISTFGNAAGHTIRQVTTKLEVIADKVVIGVSGSVGLAQRFKSEVEDLYADRKFIDKTMIQAGVLLGDRFKEHIIKEAEAARHFVPLLGQAALPSVMSGTVVGMFCEKEPQVIQFDHQGAPECQTDRLPFVALGSGQGIADPFLAFLRRVFWPSTTPSVADGVFAVVWTLQQAILTNPGGVGEPMQIAILKNEGGKDGQHARLVTTEQLEEHRGAVVDVEKYVASYRKPLANPAISSSPPEPPKGS